jgi:penicillin V acylase-like amidase (Ntn superfamily)
MKQPKTKITDIHGTDWGIKKVKTLHWNIEDKLNTIEVEFASGTMTMYDLDDEGVFTNPQGNMKGVIIWE